MSHDEEHKRRRRRLMQYRETNQPVHMSEPLGMDLRPDDAERLRELRGNIMSEVQQLESLTIDDARDILQRIGYFADDTRFAFVRLSPEMMRTLQCTLESTKCTIEDVLIGYCWEHKQP